MNRFPTSPDKRFLKGLKLALSLTLQPSFLPRQLSGSSCMTLWHLLDIQPSPMKKHEPNQKYYLVSEREAHPELTPNRNKLLWLLLSPKHFSLKERFQGQRAAKGKAMSCMMLFTLCSREMQAALPSLRQESSPAAVPELQESVSSLIIPYPSPLLFSPFQRAE